MNKDELRKSTPIYQGVLQYFPNAIAAVAECSMVANEQHNSGEPMHWAKEKSADELGSLTRHLIDHGKGDPYDDDGLLHLQKVAWRALAALERYLDGQDVSNEYIPQTNNADEKESESNNVRKRLQNGQTISYKSSDSTTTHSGRVIFSGSTSS